MMSLQWLSAAAFLYTELGLGLLLCIGIISNQRWQSIFNSRILAMIKQYGNFLFSAFVLLLLVLFADSLFSTYRFSKIDTKNIDLKNNPQAEVQAHMKLFRAQRNLYITGFSLFMLIVLRRIATLISAQATLEASHGAVVKQAKGAAEQAKKLLQENEDLRKGKRAQASDAENGEEIVELRNEVTKLKNELKNSEKKLEKSEKEFTAMKSQSEGLHKEYDRLSEEHSKLEKKVSIAGDGENNCHGETKKDH